MNNKDMQADTLNKDARKVIYDRFQIPEPMRNGTVQTYSNFETAQYVFYIQAVIPIIEEIFEALTNFFRTRKCLKPNEYLTYDDTMIKALKVSFNEQMKLKKELGIFTINELRKNYGAKEYGVEADLLYQNSSLMPLGYDINEALEEPIKEDDEANKNYFKSVLKAKGFTDKEIEEKVKSTYDINNEY
jgi:predicted metal-binding transcription factor (methanogenesis marker protein 9)